MSGLHLKLIGLIKQHSSNVGNVAVAIMHISKCSQKPGERQQGENKL